MNKLANEKGEVDFENLAGGKEERRGWGYLCPYDRWSSKGWSSELIGPPWWLPSVECHLLANLKPNLSVLPLATSMNLSQNVSPRLGLD